MVPYILIFWFTYHDAKISATAEFDSAAACTGAIFAVQNQGFTGICVPKRLESDH